MAGLALQCWSLSNITMTRSGITKVYCGKDITRIDIVLGRLWDLAQLRAEDSVVHCSWAFHLLG
jgi:hypothetical protein